MSKADLIPIAQKLLVTEYLVDGLRERGGREDRDYLTMKAVAHDLRARRDLPRSLVLREIEAALVNTELTRVGVFHNPGHLQHLGRLLMTHWPTIQQALECFGEPCGECHLKPGEKCDICGKIGEENHGT